MQTNARCEVAEYLDAKTYHETLTGLSRDICQSFIPLCVQFAGSGQPITHEVLARAGQFGSERLKSLTQHAWQTVRSSLQSIRSQLDELSFQITAQTVAGIELARELEEQKVDAIIRRHKEMYQNARAQAEKSRREDDTRFVRGADIDIFMSWRF